MKSDRVLAPEYCQSTNTTQGTDHVGATWGRRLKSGRLVISQPREWRNVLGISVILAYDIP